MPHPVGSEPIRHDLSSLVIRLSLGEGRLLLAGPLTRPGARLLHAGVSRLLRTACSSWVLDVAALTGFDRCGLRAISGTYRRALRHDRRVTLVGASVGLQGELTRLRLDRHLLDRHLLVVDRRSAPSGAHVARAVREPVRPAGAVRRGPAAEEAR
ncbi:STAS domain-containing protein [Trujillonella humicola]|uniref:STAS domain-containing protein n=1 Tax=Trujillonella humicola TaxID=3383699 RepID=UPI0039063EFF